MTQPSKFMLKAIERLLHLPFESGPFIREPNNNRATWINAKIVHRRGQGIVEKANLI